MFVSDEVYKLPIFLEMSEAGFCFFLTGSRFFGNFKEDSDWDFFVESSKEVEEWLINWGFVKEGLSMHGYADYVTTTVYKHKKYPVHVQLCLKPQLKIKAQSELKCLYDFGMQFPTSKLGRRKMWNWMMNQVELSQGRME